MKGRIRPQRRNSGDPQAQAAGPRRPLNRMTPGRGDSVREGRSYLYGPRATQRVEGDGGRGRVRGTRQLGHSPPRPRFGLGSTTRASPPPHHASGGLRGGGGIPVVPVTSAAHTWEGLTVASPFGTSEAYVEENGQHITRDTSAAMHKQSVLFRKPRLHVVCAHIAELDSGAEIPASTFYF